MFVQDDTIVAVATPPGRGGIGVVRLSGGDASAIANHLLNRSGDLEPRRATRARVVAIADDRHIRAIDDVVVTRFVAPESYTGEDVVEISGHGSPMLLNQIVALAVGLGARVAEPGEFTLRAYLNGKIDLIQAEAVRDLVDAVTPRQARAAMDQLDGTLTAAIRDVDVLLFDLCARLEASLDFPEEGFHFITRPDTLTHIIRTVAILEQLIRQGRAGRLVREGRRVVIVGRPNTGKSTLFNALLGTDRAIVASTPGTTRDLVTERIDLYGVPVTLVDTAGVRDPVDAVEEEGIERAARARSSADFVIVVLDGSEALTCDDEALLKETSGVPRVVAVNKRDRPQVWASSTVGGVAPVLLISAVTGDGVDEVARTVVGEAAGVNADRDSPAITNIRHLGLVTDAVAALNRARAAAEAGATEELVLAEANDARRALELVTGRRTTDDLLRHIFSQFCIGK